MIIIMIIDDVLFNSPFNISYLIDFVGLVWFVGFYGISTFVGYLTPNPFLCK